MANVYKETYGTTYGNVYKGIAATTMTLDPLQELQQLVGPKRVKTKEVEIEAHDPMKLQALYERRSRKPVTLGQFPRTMVKPKYSDCVCENPRDSDCRS